MAKVGAAMEHVSMQLEQRDPAVSCTSRGPGH